MPATASPSKKRQQASASSTTKQQQAPNGRLLAKSSSQAPAQAQNNGGEADAGGVQTSAALHRVRFVDWSPSGITAMEFAPASSASSLGGAQAGVEAGVDDEQQQQRSLLAVGREDGTIELCVWTQDAQRVPSAAAARESSDEAAGSSGGATAAKGWMVHTVSGWLGCDFINFLSQAPQSRQLLTPHPLHPHAQRSSSPPRKQASTTSASSAPPSRTPPLPSPRLTPPPPPLPPEQHN